MQLEVKKYLFDVQQACARIEDRLVWGVVEANLPTRMAEVDALLDAGNAD